jgi:hypothetical protein
MRHTPAPWKVTRGLENNAKDYILITAANHNGGWPLVLAECGKWDIPAAQANAALIAAAPELLAACKMAFDELGKSNTWKVSTLRLDIIRAAIKKAEVE